MTGRVVITQYGGACAICKRFIEKGEHVYWRKGEQGKRPSEIFCMDSDCAIIASSADGVLL